ncbi:MAG: GntR family transcriptional regulator [Bifidobacterium sp.]|jgi:GntR family transcriptional regulator|nr:GntR family transcriptional regulator [Bifidobacterium sp.]
MIDIDLKSRKSIYEQVIFGIKEQILSGVIAPDSKLPSVRELSKQLTVNPNTVQKAFRELESQGYIYTVSGVGSFAYAPQDITPDDGLINETRSKLADSLRELRLLIPDRQVFARMVDELVQTVEPKLTSVDRAAAAHANHAKVKGDAR